ncbi:hypothetical protein ACQKWADRAFT_301606 [Trichoderma austrokoningii]
MRPKGRPRTGSRSSRKKTTLYTAEAHEATTAILADRARGPEKIHSWVSRIYAIINQGGFDGSFGNQSKRQIL